MGFNSEFKGLMLHCHLRLGLPSGLFPSGFPYKTLYTTILASIRATCRAHPIFLDLITRPIFGKQYRSLSFSSCSLLHSPVTSSLLGPNILLYTLFSNTLSLRSSLNVSDQVSTISMLTFRIFLVISSLVFCLLHLFFAYCSK